MSRVLVVEDSRTFSAMLCRRITEEMGHEVVAVNSKAGAEELLQRDADFFVALLDLNLPDAPMGQVVDLVLARGIPSIVFTGEMDDALRDRFWAKRIVDYILKQNLDNVQYMLSLVDRLHRNPAIKVLVVDDSPSARHVVGELLRAHRYQVLEVEDGKAALALLKEHPDVRLVITDYNMPGMDGFDLVRAIRRERAKDQLAIIGVSASEGAGLSARFIKNGANDFLHKPFLTEEFYTRVTQNIELLEYIAQIKYLAEKDFLTQLYNRRFMFSAGPKLLSAQMRQGKGAVLAMLDIDHFKKINDSFGHDGGDAVLRHMSGLLAARFRTSDIVSRLGGEEFCVLATGMDPELAPRIFDGLRHALENSPACFAGQCIPFTVSMGLCLRPLESLEAMIKAADQALYAAKNGGRNRVVVAEG